MTLALGGRHGEVRPGPSKHAESKSAASKDTGDTDSRILHQDGLLEELGGSGSESCSQFPE